MTMEELNMNMQIAEASSADLQVLTDDELDNVNGGIILYLLGGFALGAAVGYGAWKLGWWIGGRLSTP